MVRDRRIWGCALAALLATGWLVLPASGAEEKPAPTAAAEPAQPVPTPAPPAQAPEDLMEPEAVEVVKRMVQALADAKSLHVRVDEEFDALQSTGETFSFGKTVDMTLSRPDRLRVVGSPRTGSELFWTYDGKHLTVYQADRNVFASVEQTGDIDSIMEFLRDDVGMKVPLAGLFSPQLRQLLLENVTSATYIDDEVLDGVSLDHVAVQYGDGVGIQLWVPQSGDALPRRLVMTFEDASGRPQFRADFREWDLSPKISDKTFAFVKPEGARAVPFVLPKRPPVAAAGEASR